MKHDHEKRRMRISCTVYGICIYIYVCSHIECFYGAIEHQSAADADVDEVPVLPRSSGETILPMEGPTPG